MRDSPAERLSNKPDYEFQVRPGKTALLIIDMQNFNIRQDMGLGLDVKAMGLEAEHAHLYASAPRVIANIRRLLEACRRTGIEPIFIRIAAQTRDGREGLRWLRGKPVILPQENSPEAQILDEVRPLTGEIVLSKTSYSAFNSTNIDQVLRNLGVDTLIVTGGMTPGCVELTIRDGVDRGYAGIVVGDACTSQRERDHLRALERLDTFNLKVTSADEVLRLIEASTGVPVSS
jgi:nicotinamidase-related amidase